DSLNMADLNVQILDTDGLTPLGTAADAPPGSAEQLADVLLDEPGSYFMRVYDGNAPAEPQLYTMSLSVVTAVTQPPTALTVTGPGTVVEGDTAQFTALASFESGDDIDVTSLTDWSVSPPSAGTIDPDGLFTAAEVLIDTVATVTGSFTAFDVTVEDQASILVSPDTPAIDVTLIPDVNPSTLTPGQHFTVDVAIASLAGDVPHVRKLQFDTTLSTGVVVDAVTFDFEALDDPSLYQLDEATDVFRAVYLGPVPVDGFIVNITDVPQVVARLDLTFLADGVLSILGPADPPTIDHGVRFEAGFDQITLFTPADGNVIGGELDVTEGSAPAIIDSEPPDGAIDARQPFEPDGSNPGGFDSIVLAFAGSAAGMTASDFAVSVDPPGDAPAVTDVLVDGDTATVVFDAIIPDRSWTTVTHVATGSSVRIGNLPADVNNDRISNANDILALIDDLNGIGGPLAIYQVDADRSGIAGASDILRVIDLLNGAGVYDPYLGATLPD
ncbi:MAG: hypothetical protein ACE5E6_04560, partial [Phycisphaerae bacterium]